MCYTTNYIDKTVENEVKKHAYMALKIVPAVEGDSIGRRRDFITVAFFRQDNKVKFDLQPNQS